MAVPPKYTTLTKPPSEITIISYNLTMLESGSVYLDYYFEADAQQEYRKMLLGFSAIVGTCHKRIIYSDGRFVASQEVEAVSVRESRDSVMCARQYKHQS